MALRPSRDVSKAKDRSTGFPLRLDRLHVAPKRLVPTPLGGAGTASAANDVAARVPKPPLPAHTDQTIVRARMVERLRASGVGDEEVLRAMGRVPRHQFVDTALWSQAYEDTSLPIGLSQTISKPSVVARMIELLRTGRGELGKVLEIGTGCGYQAAVLAELSRQVFSVERLRPLHDKARDNLAALRRDNLRLIFGDGLHGHPPNAPYDAIISAAGGEMLPQAWVDQLSIGGRLVAPMQVGADGAQALLVVDRCADGSLQQRVLEAVRFVPLKSGTG